MRSKIAEGFRIPGQDFPDVRRISSAFKRVGFFVKQFSLALFRRFGATDSRDRFPSMTPISNI
jgi:hypothetical protein